MRASSCSRFAVHRKAENVLRVECTVRAIASFRLAMEADIYISCETTEIYIYIYNTFSDVL